MAVTFNTHTGDGTTGPFPFTFEYIDETDVKVSIDGVTQATTEYTFPTASTIQFTTQTPDATKTIRIFRDTDIDDLKATFFAGSAVRAQDLNNNFEQNNFALQEFETQYVTQVNGSFSSNVDMNSNRITELADPVDAQDAVTKQYLEDNYFDDGTETITSGEAWASNDTTIATTQSIDNRVDSKIDTAITSDIGTDSTGITVTDDGDGTITLGLGAGSIDLDRIKAADIIVSGEANPNNDTTIATTAKIDDMIDDAITGDILVDGTGLTKTTSGGQTTLGISAGSVDLDRIKPDDIITYAEQNAGPTPDDDSIFTSSAAARRFDTIVQTATPSGTNWEVGKTWLQNDDDLTLKVWNGSAWTSVASGGAFREQTKVIYVDKSGGDDAQTGHRISAPKLTIKEAINDINADIDTSIKTAGSGYVEGTYNGVALTGGTTGSGLTADIVVNASGAVSTVTINSAATLQEYQIGDILTTSNANLGGSGSGFELEVTGEGDGTIVVVAAGTYQEIAPIQIKRRNVSIIGQALRSCVVHPTVATQGDHADGNHALFELNSGSFIQNLTLTGMQAGTYNAGDPNTLDSDLPKRQGWNFKFYDNAFISKSPYIQNCTNFSDSEIDNSDLRTHRPRGGTAGDTDSAPTGGGMLVDGSAVRTSSPLRSMVADSYTHVGLNGPGILVTNNGYIQATSSYAFFNKYHIKALNGGQANLAASTTDFGEKALVADGKSSSAIFTANLSTNVTDGDITFTIDAPTADASWHGTATRPQGNMLVDLAGTVYPVLSATANGSGWDVTISRPNTNNRSINDGVNGDVTTPQTVSFYLRSQIASSGHTMEYVGSGTDYSALPENGGVPDDTKQINEANGGKIWTATTDQNGKFSVGDFFDIDQRTGFVSFSAGSVAFDVVTDATPQLGGDLDTNDYKITSAGNNNVHIGPHGTGKIRVDAAIITAADNNLTLDPHGTGQVDVSTHKILNVVDPTDAQDAATKNYVDTEVATNAGNISTNTTNIATNTGNISTNTTAIAGKLSLTGGTMSGAINMGSNLISSVTDPVSAQDAATKNYVDTATAGISSDKITEGNTSAEVVDLTPDGNGHFKVTTEGTEQIRIGPNGEIGINGANYGTSGQVLTSKGLNNRVAWEDAASGATGAGGDTWAVEHDNTITTSYTITSGKNVISAGPMTVNSGATVTVPSGSNWVIA